MSEDLDFGIWLERHERDHFINKTVCIREQSFFDLLVLYLHERYKLDIEKNYRELGEWAHGKTWTW